MWAKDLGAGPAFVSDLWLPSQSTVVLVPRLWSSASRGQLMAPTVGGNALARSGEVADLGRQPGCEQLPNRKDAT